MPIPPSSSSDALRNGSPPSTVASPSFRGRCIEVLSPDKIGSLNLRSDLWHAATVASFIGFIVLSAGAYIAAQIFFPVYAPVVALSAFLLALSGASFLKKFNDWSKEYTAEAHRCIQIQHHYRDLATVRPCELQAELQNRGIDWTQIPGVSSQQPDSLSATKPLLAHARYLDGVMKKYFDEKASKGAEAAKLAAEDFGANYVKISEIRGEALFAEECGLKAKIDAAFLNAVLRKGDFNGDLETVAERIPVPWFERIRGQALGQTADPVILFKNRTLAPITHSEVVSASVADLGQRFAVAMA